MTVNSRYLLIIALLSVLLLDAHASQLNSYLSNYLPNSTISNATFYNHTTVSGSSYIVMRLAGGSSQYIVIENQSGSYTIITNVSVIQSVLAPVISTGFYPNATQLSYLNTTMHHYQDYSRPNLTQCVQQLGIVNPSTSTSYVCAANFSNAGIATCMQNTCDTVPICGGHLKYPGSYLQQFGVPSPFSDGIQNLSIIYNNLSTDYSSYYLLLSSINRTNTGQVINGLSSITGKISTIAQTINLNTVFPPPPGYTYSACNPSLPPTKQPAKCISNYADVCASVPFNSTALSGIKGELSLLQSESPSPSEIANISANSSVLAQNYITIGLTQKNGAAFTSLLLNLRPKIEALTNSSNLLLSRYGNSTLGASIHVLQNQLSIVENAGVNQDINLANKTLTAMLANATSAYNKTNATYDQVYLLAQNNTAALLAAQLSYQQVPSNLAKLANQQQQINGQIDGQIGANSSATLLPELQNIKIESSLFVAPLTIGYMIKVLDSPFITAILSPSTAPVPQKIASAPLYAALESLIIGILVLAVIFVITYFRVMRKGKMKGKKSQRTWIVVFAVLVVLVIVFTYSTYAYSASAGSFLPFNYFVNSLKASPSAYIVLNGSAASNYSIGLCAATIQGYLAKAGKSVQIVKLTNYSCVSGSNISVLGLGCYNDILSSGKPAIFISQSSSSNITYKGLYGTVLYATGNVTSGKYCTLSTLLKSV